MSREPEALEDAERHDLDRVLHADDFIGDDGVVDSEIMVERFHPQWRED